MHASEHYAWNSVERAAKSNSAVREKYLLHVGCAFALGLACTSLLSLALVDPDLWGHVRYAEELLASGELPTTATHTYTAVEHSWINHELIAELLLALGYRHVGINGLLIAKSVLGLLLLCAMVHHARQTGVPLVFAWALMLLISAALHPFFILRPQLLSFVFLGVVLLLIERGFRDWNLRHSIQWKPLGLLPLIFAVWANSHGGFAVGLCIAGFMFIGRVVEKVIAHRKLDRDCVCLGLLGMIYALATIMNPYSIELHRWLFNSLSEPRPEIAEWLPARLHHAVFWPWIGLLFVGGMSLVLAPGKRDWVKIAVMGIVAWQSALHMRHIAILAIVCGFWIPHSTYAAWKRLPLNWFTDLFQGLNFVLFRRAALIGLLVVVGWLGMSLEKQLNGLPVARNSYPIDAVQFMADQDLQGKLVVSFNWAQYTIAALAPRVQVALDGRFRSCYPQEIIDMNFDFQLGDSGGLRHRSSSSNDVHGGRVLEHYEPNLVLIDRCYDHAVEVMRNKANEEKPQWTLLYCDRIAELWGRVERYSNPTSSHYLPLARRVLDSSSRFGEIPWPALPVPKEKPHIAGKTSALEKIGG